MLEQVAAGFGVHPITLSKWLRRADTDEGAGPATAPGEPAGLHEARKRIRLLEQENEVVRRTAAYPPQADLPPERRTRSSASRPPPLPLAGCRWLASPVARKTPDEDTR
ncbi:transposase [Streptomyces sp. NPDC014344]|uniref:transposase n=1 Tax=Streptomyces sp. NPDC014344 TaxID=3364871 RepID=UPI0036FBCE56